MNKSIDVFTKINTNLTCTKHLISSSHVKVGLHRLHAVHNQTLIIIQHADVNILIFTTTASVNAVK